MKKIFFLMIMFICPFVLISSCGLNYKQNLDPSALSKSGVENSAYLYGTYEYEMKSPMLDGNDGGFLALEIYPAGQTDEKPFLIQMDHDNGFYLYSLKPGHYEIRQLVYLYQNQPMPVKSIKDFIIEVKEKEMIYMGKNFLYLKIDTGTAITIGIHSNTNETEADLESFRQKTGETNNNSIKSCTNTINIPRQVFSQLD